MDSNCDNACNLALCLLGLLTILLALRYYYMNRTPIQESFDSYLDKNNNYTANNSATNNSTNIKSIEP